MGKVYFVSIHSQWKTSDDYATNVAEHTQKLNNYLKYGKENLTDRQMATMAEAFRPVPRATPIREVMEATTTQAEFNFVWYRTTDLCCEDETIEEEKYEN